MPKLSDTQLVILSNACQRDDRLVLPLPDRIKGGAARKVVDSLLAKGLVEEIAAAVDQPVWRETEDDRRLTLVAPAPPSWRSASSRRTCHKGPRRR